jgi:hypothetical protein
MGGLLFVIGGAVTLLPQVMGHFYSGGDCGIYIF